MQHDLARAVAPAGRRDLVAVDATHAWH